MNLHIHFFVGAFDSLASACEYTEPQWEPEPDENATDQEYREWEDRNPSWKMQSDLDVYLDSDFVGTTELDSELEYLSQILVDERDLDRIRAISSPNDNILVQIFSEALGGFLAEMKSTPRLKYCGLFECDVSKASEHLGVIPDSVHLVLEGPGTVVMRVKLYVRSRSALKGWW